MAAWFWLRRRDDPRRARRARPRRPRSGGTAGRAAPRSPRRRCPRPAVHGTAASRRRLVAVDDVERLGGRVDELDRAGDDAPERVASRSRREGRSGSSAARASGWSRSPASAIRAVGPSRYGLAVARPRLERVRPRRPAPPGTPAPSRRARGRGRRSRRCGPRSSGTRSGGGGDEQRGSRSKAGGSNVGHQRDGRRARSRAPSSSSGRRRRSVAAPGRAREAADADADRVDRPAAERRDRIWLPVFLSASAALDEPRWSRASSMALAIAEEVGRVEQVDVERVALDPLAAVQQPAQRADRRVDLDADERPRTRGPRVIW